MIGANARISEHDVLNTLWLLMYHYDIDIVDFIHGKSFLYDKVLKMKGRDKKTLLAYWKQVLK